MASFTELRYRALARELRVPKKSLRECWASTTELGLTHYHREHSTATPQMWVLPGNEKAVFEKIFWHMYERIDRGAVTALGTNGADQNPPFLKEGVPLRIWNTVRIEPHSIDDAADLSRTGVRSMRRWFDGDNPGRAAFAMFESFLWKYDFIDIFHHIDIARDVELVKYSIQVKES